MQQRTSGCVCGMRSDSCFDNYRIHAKLKGQKMFCSSAELITLDLYTLSVISLQCLSSEEMSTSTNFGRHTGYTSLLNPMFYSQYKYKG